ncbi:MAG TPA: hypothetical protein VFU03_10915 [Gemmatimonadales bacterium]|nr:hypothetical protein [Gemmatimonadales bacterium]
MTWRGMGGSMVALIVACHHTKDTAVEPASSEILLIVESHHQIDVVINLIHNSTTERLGTVPPGATQKFTIPVRRLGPGGRFHLGAFHLGATEGYVTEELNATGGEEIRWKLEKYLAQSVVHYQ